MELVMEGQISGMRGREAGGGKGMYVGLEAGKLGRKWVLGAIFRGYIKLEEKHAT